jgi:glycosyltransferase involved in cell wall biosynthesis
VVRLVLAIDHLGSGGAQRQLCEIAYHLHQHRGVHTHVLVYHDVDFFAERLREADVPVTCIRKRAKLDPTLPPRMARFFAREEPDVVHAFMLAPGLWSLLASRLLLHRRPAFVAAERLDRIATNATQGALQRLLYGAADGVTVNAAPVLGDIQRRLGIPRERLFHVPNGIDLAAWDRACADPCPLELEKGVFHLALVGRLEPQKDHELLIQALARLGPDIVASWRVWLVGAASGEAAYVERIREAVRAHDLGEVVRFVPPLSDLAALVSRLDGLVLPSRYEGFPNVILEAMAARVPSVATRVGEVPYLLDDGRTGFTVPAGDAEALANALQRLAALGPCERRAMGERARAVVEERYTLATVADAYLDVYLHVSGARTRGALA